MTFCTSLVRCAAVALATACTAGSPAGSPSTDPAGGARRDVEFAESALVPVTAPAHTDGIATVPLLNRRGSPVEVVRVEPQADPGLTATYLGHSDCRTGCVGEGYWSDTEARGRAERSVAGTVPLTLAPNTALSLVFRITATTAADSLVRHGCRLRVRAVRLTLASGETVVASGPDDTVVGLHRPDVPTPPADCR